MKFSARRKPSPEGYWLRLSRQAMACRFEAILPSFDHAGTLRARDALVEADKLEAQLTIFKDTSEVSLINRFAASGPMQVEPSLFDLLLLCQTLCSETSGAFDITSSPLSDCWGFLRRQGRIPQLSEIENARAIVGRDKMILDCDARTIRFTNLGVRINLGSIGKGYALDRITARLNNQTRGCLLSAGSSSIRAIGNGEGGEGWAVGVRHPIRNGSRLATLRLRDCAMATSGSEEQFFEHNGARYGHIIDPRTGYPADCVSSATVIARSAAIADALATAFFVGGPRLAESYCSTHPGVLAILLETKAERAVVFGSNARCEAMICE